MKTVIAPATPEAVARAAQIIRAGGLIAFPTETVYGLGANALDAAAAARIYEAKQRALNDPLIVHVATPAVSTAGWHTETRLSAFGVSARQFIDALCADGVVEKLSDEQLSRVEVLATRFWPGPLTLILPRGVRIPANVSAGLDTVAIRMPDHPIAQALIEASGVPIAAPSANHFGHVSPTTAQHVIDDLDGRIDMVLDGGPTRIGMESTVLDLTNDTPRILRPGGITREQITEVLKIRDWGSEIRQSPISNSQSLPSPGMLEKHYAPNAQLIVCRDVTELIDRQTSNVKRQLKTGVLIRASEREACKDMHPQFVLGDTMSDIARNLYAGLRALDSADVDVILMTDVPREGLGEAIADRLKRAAAK